MEGFQIDFLGAALAPVLREALGELVGADAGVLDDETRLLEAIEVLRYFRDEFEAFDPTKTFGAKNWPSAAGEPSRVMS